MSKPFSEAEIELLETGGFDMTPLTREEKQRLLEQQQQTRLDTIAFWTELSEHLDQFPGINQVISKALETQVSPTGLMNYLVNMDQDLSYESPLGWLYHGKDIAPILEAVESLTIV